MEFWKKRRKRVIGSVDKDIKNNRIRIILGVLNPDLYFNVEDRIKAANFLGNLTEDNLNKSLSPIRDSRRIIEIGYFQYDNIITRLIKALKDEDFRVRQAAANSLVNIVTRFNNGEFMSFYNPCDSIMIGAALDNMGDSRGYELLEKAVKNKILTEELQKEIPKYETGLYKSLYWHELLGYLNDINRDLLLDFLIELSKFKETKSKYLKNKLLNAISAGILGSWNINCLNDIFMDDLDEFYLEPNGIKCPHCNEITPFESNFCMECGSKTRKVYSLNVLDKKRKEMESKGLYKLIENFVSKKYSKKLFTRSNYMFVDEGSYNFKEKNIHSIEKLKYLLENKGMTLNYNELFFFIYNEQEKQCYIDFRSNITFNQPSKLEDFLKNYIEVYKPEEFKTNHSLSNQYYSPSKRDDLLHNKFTIKLLRENGYIVNDEDVFKKIKKLIKVNGISSFEEEIMDDTF